MMIPSVLSHILKSFVSPRSVSPRSVLPIVMGVGLAASFFSGPRAEAKRTSGAFSLEIAAAVEPRAIKSTLEAQSTCQNFVRHDDRYLYLGFGPYMKGAEKPRLPIPGRVEVTAFEDQTFKKTLETLDGAIDAVTVGDRLYVLTYSAIEVWDRTTWTRTSTSVTYMASTPMRYREHATGMALFGNKLVISHGRLGVSIFNVETNRLQDQKRILTSQLPLESQVMGLTKVGPHAVLLIDGFSLVEPGAKGPFTGLVVFDPLKGQVVREIRGLRPGVDMIQTWGDRLLIGAGGFMGRYTTNALNGATIDLDPNPIGFYGIEGAYPINRFVMDETHVYACMNVPPEIKGKPYVRKPMALDRKSLGL